MYLIAGLAIAFFPIVYSILGLPGAGYVSLIFQLLLAAALIGAFFVLSSFQSETMRYNSNNAVSTTLLLAALLLAAAPMIITLISSGRLIFTVNPPLVAPWAWLGIAILCAGLSWGMVTLDEYVGPIAQKAKWERTNERLTQQAKAGNGEKACELAIQGAPDSDAYFGFCKSYIESLADTRMRWDMLQNFTTGGGFITRNVGSDSNAKRSVIPPEEQLWFLHEFFKIMLTVPPSDKPAGVMTTPDANFNDLLSAGNLLSSLAEQQQWDPHVLKEFAHDTLPEVKNHYDARLAEADKASQHLQFDQDGFVVQSGPSYTYEAESAYTNAKWFRENLAKLQKMSSDAG